MENDSHAAQYRRIRDFTMNLIYRSEARQVKLPSTRELAARFGVARNTAQRAINELAAENYVIVRHGIGTFTNPARAAIVPAGVPLAIIGLVIGDGRIFIHDSGSWPQLGAAGNALTRRYYRIRCLEMPDGDPEHLRKEIAGAYLDGLVWLLPPPQYDPLLRRLNAEEMPLAVSGRLLPGICSVALDYFGEGLAAGRRFLAEGRRRLFIGSALPEELPHLPGFCEAYREAGADFGEATLFPDRCRFLEQLEAAVAGGNRPDSFFLAGSYLAAILKILERNKIGIPGDCLILSGENSIRYPQFRGLIHEPPFAEAGEKLAGMIERQLEHRDSEVEHCLLPIPLKEIL